MMMKGPEILGVGQKARSKWYIGNPTKRMTL